ncbi:MAG: TspO/MBR family protein [Bauldia sp.]
MANTATYHPRSRRQDWAALGAFLVLAALAGGLGSLATTPNIPTWYAALAKPWFNPPNVVFPLVWTALYVLIAVSGWLAWRAPARTGTRALTPYFLQFALNVAWSFAFFAAHSPLAGLVVIALLAVAILWTVAAFWPISRTGALLLLPYLLWVAFATVLNAAIYALN